MGAGFSNNKPLNPSLFPNPLYFNLNIFKRNF